MLQRLGTLISRSWPLVLFAWVAVLLSLYVFTPWSIPVTAEAVSARLPASAESVRGQKLLARAFRGVETQSQICLIVARTDGPLTTRDFATADALADHFIPGEEVDRRSAASIGLVPESHSSRLTQPVVGVLTHRTPVVGRELVSAAGDNGQATLVILQLHAPVPIDDGRRLMIEVHMLLDAVRAASEFPANLELGVAGPAAIAVDQQSAAARSWFTAMIIGAVLLTLAIAAACRVPALAAAAWSTVAATVIAVWGLSRILLVYGGTSQLAPLGPMDPRGRFAVIVAAAAAASYALLLVLPYGEEMRRTGRSHRALRKAYPGAARTILAGSTTSLLAFSALMACRLSDFRDAVPLLALAVVMAAAAATTLAPAVLRLWGENLYFPGRVVGPSIAAAGLRIDRRGGLKKETDLATRRPLSAIGVATLLLIVPALFGLTNEPSHDALAQLPPGMPSTHGTRLLERYFPAGELGPIVVLAFKPGGQFLAREALWEEIEPLASQLRDFSYRDSRGRVVHPIDSVRSLTDPLGKLPERSGLLGLLHSTLLRRHSRIQRMYVALEDDYLGQVTRFDLISGYNPFSQDSIRLLGELREFLARIADDPTSTWYGTEFYLLGTTASIADLSAVSRADLQRMSLLIPTVVFVALLMASGRVALSCWTIVSLGLVVAASLGLSHLALVLGRGAPFEGIDYRVPMLLLLILFAIGVASTLAVFDAVATQRVDDPAEIRRRRRKTTFQTVLLSGLAAATAFAGLPFGQLGAVRQTGTAAVVAMLLLTILVQRLSLPAFAVVVARLQLGGRPLIIVRRVHRHGGASRPADTDDSAPDNGDPDHR